MIGLLGRAGPVLLDAGLGTALVGRGLALPAEDAISWSLSHAEAVSAVHRAHVAAGAELVLANTFGARAPEEPELRAALALARASGAAHVAVPLWPGLPAPSLARAVEGAARAGAELIWLETAIQAGDAEQALRLARDHSPLPIAVTLALASFPSRQQTRAVEELCDLLAALAANGAAVVGLNCGPWDLPAGLGVDLPALVAQLAPEIPAAFALKPDAGTRPPESWAGVLAECASAGARWLGGCCGTDARHLQLLRDRCPRAPRSAPPQPT